MIYPDTDPYPAYIRTEREKNLRPLSLSVLNCYILSCQTFGNHFAGLKEDRKLTHEELVHAIRFMISAEYEAIQLYQQLAESIDNKRAIEVLEDIENEEKVHAGEFLRLLHELDPKESGYYHEGAEEVEAEIKKFRG